jgi:hypothetical protein
VAPADRLEPCEPTTLLLVEVREEQAEVGMVGLCSGVVLLLAERAGARRRRRHGITIAASSKKGNLFWDSSKSSGKKPPAARNPGAVRLPSPFKVLKSLAA